MGGKDELAESLNDLFTSVSTMIKSELQGTNNHLELLEKMNLRVAEEYKGFGDVASGLRIFVAQLKSKSSCFDQYVQQIDAIEQQVTEFEIRNQNKIEGGKSQVGGRGSVDPYLHPRASANPSNRARFGVGCISAICGCEIGSGLVLICHSAYHLHEVRGETTWILPTRVDPNGSTTAPPRCERRGGIS
ncbi:Biogenesis of lysosome-related organelles complex 1 subunit 2 [Morella rubra]|uniref:Biogenesis of lysosome-related organelles complex 1 subunit 2 n=1 Tax=Morella rubra TaxID=262757 RepID=A0A6A1WGL6_9ROSI|nr:Biogenesis of lysosome-related organelles complex 1 subunit 2 [Morella rubra]